MILFIKEMVLFKYYKIFLASIFYVISIFFYNYSSYMDYKQKEIKVVDDKLKIGAYAVYNILGEDFFKNATNKDSISQEEDWENINKLSYYNNHANLAFIYSSIKKDNKVYLTSSSASKEELEEKSELHYFHYYEDAGESLVNSFESKELLYENYTDKWGSFRAVHIPLTLENSQIIVISAEVSMEAFNKIIDDIKYKYLEETLLYLLLTLPIIFTTYLLIKEKTLENLKMEQDMMRSEKMAALGEMIANIAHQWRQPLSQLSGLFIDIESAYDYKELNKKYLQNRVEEANDLLEYMSKTIDDFRNFFNPNSIKEEFFIKTSVENAIKIVKSTLDFHHIELLVDIDESLKIIGFKNEYSQAVMNIISNAKDVLIDKKIQNPQIKIYIEKIDKIILCIEDNAGGINENIIDKIFDPYFTTKYEYGTGIGLYMTKLIIEDKMNGTISAQNVSDGAKFFIEI